MTNSHNRILLLASQIAIAYPNYNDTADITSVLALIQSIYKTLREVTRELSRTSSLSEQLNHDHNLGATSRGFTRHVHRTYGQTVFDDRLICMEDGLSMTMLKRHLLKVHDMTPEEYRAKWGLPKDYAMITRNYARLRSSLALQNGLGLKADARGGESRR